MSEGQLETWQRVRQLFGEASALDTEEREAFLASACLNQPEVESQVRDLLKAHDGAGEFLEHSPVKGHSALRGQLASEMTDPFPGALLKGRYKVKEKIGEGGFGNVYCACDQDLDGREVVVKALRRNSTGESAEAEWFDRRFQLERQALARVEHPSVVGVLDCGDGPGGIPFLVMQYVKGQTLRAVLNDGPMKLERLCRLTVQLAEGLDAVHAVQVLHRDLKPENIVIRDSGSARELAVLIDFGIARIESPTTHTTTYVAGSPAYMAPEQLRGKAVPASDQYSLARVVFEALTARRLHDSEFNLLNHVHPAVPAGARTAIRRALSDDPAQRFASVCEFAQALTPVSKAVSRRVAAAGVAASLVTGALVVYGLRSRDGGSPPSPAGLSFTVFARNGATSVPVDPAKRIFFTGDALRLQVSATRQGHLYVVNEGSSSIPTDPRYILLHAGQVSARQVISIPVRQDDWIEVDAKPGTERIWAIWSHLPLAELRDLNRYLRSPHFGLIADSAVALKLRDLLKLHPDGRDRMITEISLRHE